MKIIPMSSSVWSQHSGPVATYFAHPPLAHIQNRHPVAAISKSGNRRRCHCLAATCCAHCAAPRLCGVRLRDMRGRSWRLYVFLVERPAAKCPIHFVEILHASPFTFELRKAVMWIEPELFTDLFTVRRTAGGTILRISVACH